MDIPKEVLAEIEKHDLSMFKRLDEGHFSVFWAIKFLEENNYQVMARVLHKISLQGNIRLGPLEGFVAVGGKLPQGDFILLSDRFIEYTTRVEFLVSLVSEIGSFQEFASSLEENEQRAVKAKEWIEGQLSRPTGTTILTRAVQKTGQYASSKKGFMSNEQGLS